jgi:hypothetical protein
MAKAFSSEAGTGSREENAAKQAARALRRFGDSEKRGNALDLALA